LIKRPRARLFIAGLALCAVPLIALRNTLVWWLALPPLLAGAYLLTWATLGKGMWCRQCKSF
jgi:hypothetical protein